jgi:hypothetical protein
VDIAPLTDQFQASPRPRTSKDSIMKTPLMWISGFLNFLSLPHAWNRPPKFVFSSRFSSKTDLHPSTFLHPDVLPRFQLLLSFQKIIILMH